MKKLFFSVFVSMLSLAAVAQKKQIFTLQYAGSTGYLSVGVGVSSKSLKLQHELLYGFVPKAYGGPLDKITYRLTYAPFRVPISKGVTWLPVNPVAFVAYNFGSDFTIEQSYKKYDDDYYWWSPAVRFHLGGNTAVFLNSKSGTPRAMIFLEMNTNDRYITTWWDNTENLPLGDIFFLGAGVKLLID